MKNELINLIKQNNIQIYCISGTLGSGKNYIAENILYPMLPQKQTMFVSLADHFKIDVITKDGIPYEKVFIEKDDESRRKLQIRGTEEGRNLYGEDIWINTLLTWMRVHIERKIKVLFLMDCRFINELLCFKELGATTIRIVSPERNRQALLRESKGDQKMYDKIATHPSETELDNHLDKFDHIIYNDYKDVDTVQLQVYNIVSKINNKIEKPEWVLFCDLDDSVCHCSIYYQEVIKEFKEYVRKFYKESQKEYFESVFDANISSTHSDAYYKKPFSTTQFPDSLLDVFVKMMGNINVVVTDEHISDIKKLGYKVYDEQIYAPLKNNLEVLSELEKIGKIVLYTKGDRLVQTRKIVSLGLTKYDREIVTLKSVDILHDLMAKHPAKNYAVIGDSFLNDIIPALEVGIKAIHYTDKPNVMGLEHPNYTWIQNYVEVLEHVSSKLQTV
jgi:putative hydrolase of the HAD superfamily